MVPRSQLDHVKEMAKVNLKHMAEMAKHAQKHAQELAATREKSMKGRLDMLSYHTRLVEEEKNSRVVQHTTHAYVYTITYTSCTSLCFQEKDNMQWLIDMQEKHPGLSLPTLPGQSHTHTYTHTHIHTYTRTHMHTHYPTLHIAHSTYTIHHTHRAHTHAGENVPICMNSWHILIEFIAVICLSVVSVCVVISIPTFNVYVCVRCCRTATRFQKTVGRSIRHYCIYLQIGRGWYSTVAVRG